MLLKHGDTGAQPAACHCFMWFLRCSQDSAARGAGYGTQCCCQTMGQLGPGHPKLSSGTHTPWCPTLSHRAPPRAFQLVRPLGPPRLSLSTPASRESSGPLTATWPRADGLTTHTSSPRPRPPQSLFPQHQLHSIMPALDRKLYPCRGGHGGPGGLGGCRWLRGATGVPAQGAGQI